LQTSALVGVLDISILVFREGLECVLVLAAITANMRGGRRRYQTPVFVGAAVAAAATVVTWRLVVDAVRDLSEVLPALQVQAATGLLAVLVLLLVMNWFFHRVYWTGWIAAHSRRKEAALRRDASSRAFGPRTWWTLGFLGFTAVYREGFEVVLFLQSYRFRFGSEAVLLGLWIGLLLSSAAAVATFVAHRRLPYRRMLVLTGVLLGVVLLVMVGEEAQEMQLARWLPTTTIGWLDGRIPGWLGTWLSIFPTVETLAAQTLAAGLVLGSYAAARSAKLPAAEQLSEPA
jgi:high-affinity iron transporter